MVSFTVTNAKFESFVQCLTGSLLIGNFECSPSRLVPSGQKPPGLTWRMPFLAAGYQTSLLHLTSSLSAFGDSLAPACSSLSCSSCHPQERLLVLESSVTQWLTPSPGGGTQRPQIPPRQPAHIPWGSFFPSSTPPLVVEAGHLNESPCSKPRRPRITDQQLKGNLCNVDSGSSRPAFQQ